MYLKSEEILELLRGLWLELWWGMSSKGQSQVHIIWLKPIAFNFVRCGGSFTENRHARPLSDSIVPEERNARRQGVEQAWRETIV